MLNKILLSILLSYVSLSTSAATITYFEDKEVGSREFIAINSSQIYSIYYNEDDKILRAVYFAASQAPYVDFKVSSFEKAQDIIRKVYDMNDSSFIELEQD